MIDNENDPMDPNKLQDIKVKIEDVAYGGSGVGRIDGKTIFVEDTIPGDLVSPMITEEKKSYSRAKVSHYFQKSSLRVRSKCPYTECGGCQWNEASYESQKAWKKSFVTRSLEKIAKVSQPIEIDFFSGQSYHYRNRVLLRGEIKADGRIGVGFFKKGSRTQIHIEHCAIAAKLINGFIGKIKNLRVNVKAQKFRLEVQEFPYFSQHQKAGLTVLAHQVEAKKTSLAPLIDALQSIEEVLWAGLASETKNLPFLGVEQERGITYFSSPGQFYQVNLELNKVLRTSVQEDIEQDKDVSSILDLFCGGGNLSLALANGKRHIKGIEISKTAIHIAKFAVQANKLSNCSYRSVDSIKYLKELKQGKKAFDAIILDPPRAGLKEGVDDLLGLSAKKIYYVSCDPNTLARDLAHMLKDYELKKIECYDFFPQTFHVETLAFLEKKSK